MKVDGLGCDFMGGRNGQDSAVSYFRELAFNFRPLWSASNCLPPTPKDQPSPISRDLSREGSTTPRNVELAGCPAVEVETSGSPIPNDQLPRYGYTPLRSKELIRLIHFVPTLDAKIVLSLSEHILKDAPPYQALSYTWGDPSNVRDITILTPITTSASHDGSVSQSYPLHDRLTRFRFQDRVSIRALGLDTSSQQEVSAATLSVTYNCYSALRRLAYLPVHSDRAVWIDSICINQDDIQERNSQVALMSRIYLRCLRLVIDVGDESPTSDAAIDFIVQYHRHREAGKLDEHGVYDMTTGLHIRDIISEFYARPWFSRIWVLQEVYHGARSLRDERFPALLNCGRRSVEWSKFRPLHINVDSRPAGETENWYIELPTVAALPLVLRIVPRGWGGSISVDDKKLSWPRYVVDDRYTLDLLCLARINKATDPRDKVFALLSLQEFLSKDFPLKPDYGKSITEVYVETAVWLLRRVAVAERCGKSVSVCSRDSLHGCPTGVRGIWNNG
ncbi:heterokaryon incompatibility protein-domain-containing protein [Neurospora tetraspora]|uniref:Heterokaryon incompatibility protein-domain-containing protein n=1 Tax=Neurospora tetraspora TaxID=94610 RepID=A0AAE0JRD5_9PEZI|nr:heterokaryon incompatibility protein-domain-containing protein [Neurospora tetraspora]